MSAAPKPPPAQGQAFARAAAAASPVARERDIRLDFYRGLAMFIILFAHTPGNLFTSWIPARFGFSDATEIFVFCSGMASAIAFGAVYANRGWPMGSARIAFRVWQVYWAHVGLFLAVAATVAALNASGLFMRDYVAQLNLYPFFEDTAANLIGLLTLSYVPNYFDILPMYLVILAMVPLMMGLARIDPRLALAGSALIWAATQVGGFAQGGYEALAPLAARLEFLHLPAQYWFEPPNNTRNWFFNPFGWQLVFFTGFGFMRGWIPAPPVRPWLIGLALAVVLVNIPLSHIGMRELGTADWARDWRIANTPFFDKTDFGILRYTHFLSLAYLGWVAAGSGGHRLKADPRGMLGAAWGRLLRWILKVGQQSLAVFITSMWLARILGVWLDEAGRNLPTFWLVNVTGCAVLIAVAYVAGWFKSHPWRKPKV
ncbi:hypothetical protein DDZ14_01280 [Maritimibacter sp. 55A14]|nr:hypothetical protein DDZ14_01280 [Maritimibacter sp. 55A14]